MRIRPIASSAFTPITESCGPVIPASVTAAVPFGCTRASFVCTCVCVPITAVTRPSSQRAIAIFSLVASAWKSRTTTGACARASSTSPSTISHGDTACRDRASRAGSAPRPSHRCALRRRRAHGRESTCLLRRPDDALARGEVVADAGAAVRVVAERDDVGAGGEQLVRELRVMPAPSAMFSPFTMQTSAPSSSRSPGSRSSTARRPATPNTSARKRTLSSGPATLRGGSRSRRGCPGRSCSARAPDARRPRDSTTVPRRVAPLTTFEPSLSDGSARSCVSDTTSDGALCGWMSMRVPNLCPPTMYGVMPTTVPSTGAYTFVPGHRADVERRRRAASSRYQTWFRLRRRRPCGTRAEGRPRSPDARSAQAVSHRRSPSGSRSR